MYDAAIIKELNDKYGISSPGNCNRCKIKKAASYNRNSSLLCGARACLMLTEYNMLKMMNDYKSGIYDPQSESIIKAIYKLTILGHNYEIEPPWVIWTSNTGKEKRWMNVNSRVYDATGYKHILHKGDVLICSREDPNMNEYSNINIFSIQCGNRNLVDGIPNVSYKASNFERWANNDGYITLTAVDDRGSKASLVVSKYGDRLLVPFDAGLIQRNVNGNIHIEFSNNHAGLVITDERLNIIKQNNVMFAFKI